LFKIAIQGIVIVIFLCIYVLQHKLVHTLYFSPFYLSPFLMISIGSKILHSFLYRKCIHHIHLLNFLPLPAHM
jgi:hypothetical protein